MRPHDGIPTPDPAQAATRPSWEIGSNSHNVGGRRRKPGPRHRSSGLPCQEKEESLLADGEERLSQLRAAAKPVVPDITDEMQRMQRHIVCHPVMRQPKTTKGWVSMEFSYVGPDQRRPGETCQVGSLWWESVGWQSREARYRLLAILIGEASQPGRASRSRRSQRLRALQRSLDSGGASDFHDDAMAGPTQVDSKGVPRGGQKSGDRVSGRVVPPEIHAMTDLPGQIVAPVQDFWTCLPVISTQVVDGARH